VDGLTLQQDMPDQFRWKFTQSGLYSSKSSYAAFFLGAIKFGSWRGFGKAGHLHTLSFTCGWCFTIGAGWLIA